MVAPASGAVWWFGGLVVVWLVTIVGLVWLVASVGLLVCLFVCLFVCLLVGAVTAAPFSMMTHCLRVIRGEISTEVAVLETLKDTTLGAGIGGVSAMSITTIAAACPPVAVALTAASPLLLTVGAGAMVYEFFKILEDHKQEVRAYYQQLTAADLERLAGLETEWQYQHQKNLDFIQQSRQVNAQISDRPLGTSIEDALNRYRESAAMALSLGAIDAAEMPILPGTHSRFLPAQEM